MWKANIQKIPTTTEVISLDSTDITDLNSAPVITSENLIDNLPLEIIAETISSSSEQNTVLGSSSSEETLKDTLERLLVTIKADNNFVFQWLFIMYLEDMISKVK